MDNVNHPAHYEQNTSIECIDSMLIAFGPEALFDFCLCNAYKYIWRHKHKNGLEDLEKAEWYISKASWLAGTYEKMFAPDNDRLALLRVICNAARAVWVSTHT